MMNENSMTEVIRRDGHDFLVGITWKMAQDAGDLRQTLKEIPRASAKIILRPKEDHRSWIGTVEGRVPKRAIALAPLIGVVFGDAIVALKLPGETESGEARFWLCATNQGMPLPTKDIIIPGGKLRDELSEWMTYYPSVKIYGDAGGAADDDEAFWALINEALKSKSVSKKALKQMMPIVPMGTKEVTTLLVRAAVLAGIGLGGWWGWQWVMHVPQPDLTSITDEQRHLAEQQARFRAQKQAEEDARRQEILRREQIEQEILHIYSSAAARHSTLSDEVRKDPSPWLNMPERIPRQVRGYYPRKLDCRHENCELRWERAGFAMASLLGRYEIPGFVEPPVQNIAEDAQPRSQFLVPQESRSPDVMVTIQSPNLVKERSRVIDAIQEIMGPISSVRVEPFRAETQPGLPEYAVPPIPIAWVAGFSASFSGALAIPRQERFMGFVRANPMVVDRYALTFSDGQYLVEMSGRLILMAPESSPPTQIEWEGDPATPVLVQG